MTFNMNALMLSGELALKGMVAIFVVIIAIYICVSIMLKATQIFKKKDQ